MDMKNTLRSLLQEMVMPDISKIKENNTKILSALELTNKRLDDVNTHLADQSRRIDEVRTELGQRIDEVRTELGQRIDETNKRIDETNKRIDEVRTELGQRIDETNKRIEAVQSELGHGIQAVRSELGARIDEVHRDLVNRIDGNNARIDRFFETGVTQKELVAVNEKINRMKGDIDFLRQKIAA